MPTCVPETRPTSFLFKLAEAGDIERVKRGVYGLPGTKAAVDGKARSGGKNGKKERSTEQATENKEKRDDDQSFSIFRSIRGRKNSFDSHTNLSARKTRKD